MRGETSDETLSGLDGMGSDLPSCTITLLIQWNFCSDEVVMVRCLRLDDSVAHTHIPCRVVRAA